MEFKDNNVRLLTLTIKSCTYHDVPASQVDVWAIRQGHSLKRRRAFSGGEVMGEALRCC